MRRINVQIKGDRKMITSKKFQRLNGLSVCLYIIPVIIFLLQGSTNEGKILSFFTIVATFFLVNICRVLYWYHYNKQMFFQCDVKTWEEMLLYFNKNYIVKKTKLCYISQLKAYYFLGNWEKCRKLLDMLELEQKTEVAKQIHFWINFFECLYCESQKDEELFEEQYSNLKKFSVENHMYEREVAFMEAVAYRVKGQREKERQLLETMNPKTVLEQVEIYHRLAENYMEESNPKAYELYSFIAKHGGTTKYQEIAEEKIENTQLDATQALQLKAINQNHKKRNRKIARRLAVVIISLGIVLSPNYLDFYGKTVKEAYNKHHWASSKYDEQRIFFSKRIGSKHVLLSAEKTDKYEYTVKTIIFSVEKRDGKEEYIWVDEISDIVRVKSMYEDVASDMDIDYSLLLLDDIFDKKAPAFGFTEDNKVEKIVINGKYMPTIERVRVDKYEWTFWYMESYDYEKYPISLFRDSSKYIKIERTP